MATINAVNQARANLRQAHATTAAAYDQLTATLDPEQRRLLNAYSDARTDQHCAEEDMAEAVLLAHAGGLAPLLRAVLAHCRASAPCSCPEVS